MSIENLRKNETSKSCKRAKRYYVGKNPPFKTGIIDGELVSISYALKYANDIQIQTAIKMTSPVVELIEIKN